MADDFWDVPQATSGSDDFWDAPTPAKPPKVQVSYPINRNPTIAGDIDTFLRATGKEASGGISAIQNAAQTGKQWTSYLPEALQGPLTQGAAGLGALALGVGQVMGSPLYGGARELMREGLERQAANVGLEKYAQPIGEWGSQILAMLAPEGVQNALPNLLAKTVRGVAQPLKRVHAAEALNRANRATNEQALSEALDSYAGQTARQQALGQQATSEMAGVRAAESAIAKEAPGLRVEVPLTQRLSTGRTGKEIYQPVNDLSDAPVGLSSVMERANRIVQQYGGDAPAVLKPASIIKAGEQLQGAATNEFLDLSKHLQGMGGQMSLRDVQQSMQGLQKLTRSADSRVASEARGFYWDFITDLEKAGEAGKPLLVANKEFRRNLASTEIGDFIANNVAKYKDGRLEVNADKLANFLKQEGRKARYIRDSFEPQQWKEITDTVENVFAAKAKAVTDAPINKAIPFKSPKRLPEDATPEDMAQLAPHARSLLSALGYQGFANWGAGQLLSAAPNFYVNRILAAAQKPGGRAMLERLYRFRPPSLTDDLVRASALTRFLQENPNQ